MGTAQAGASCDACDQLFNAVGGAARNQAIEGLSASKRTARSLERVIPFVPLHQGTPPKSVERHWDAFKVAQGLAEVEEFSSRVPPGPVGPGPWVPWARVPWVPGPGPMGPGPQPGSQGTR